MIKKNTILILIFSISQLGVKAQDIDKHVLDQFSVGAGLGITQFYGDIMETKDIKPAFSVQLSKKIKNMPSAGMDNHHSIQVEFIMGRISGKNSFYSFCENPHHTIEGIPVHHKSIGEKFDAEFIEFDINLLLNLSVVFDEIISQKEGVEIGYIQKAKDRKLNFLAKVGIGLNMFRTVRKELGTDQFINSYGYQWLWENDYKDAGTKHLAWSETITERTFVLGFITNYKISQRFALDFSATSRIGGNDKWDAKLDDKYDMFIFYSLGTTIRLNK